MYYLKLRLSKSGWYNISAGPKIQPLMASPDSSRTYLGDTDSLPPDHRFKQLPQLPHLDTILFSNRFERRIDFCLNTFLAECELQ